jgi:hypothetical protein
VRLVSTAVWKGKALSSLLIVAYATVVGIVLAIVAAFITAVFTLAAWNTVIPQVFGGPAIDFVQAFALNLLAALLIKSK